MIAARARAGLRDFWAAGSEPKRGRLLLGGLLAAAEPPFRVAVAARNRWHDGRPPDREPIPVVSVGNLTVGGTGKTPVIRWLHDWFAGRRMRAAVVVRGYGEDEVALYRRWFGSGAVFVGADRVAGVRAACESGHEVALLDDGFQHRRAARTVDILLLAAEDPWTVRLLPRGPYREPLASAARASHILVTRRTADTATTDAWIERLSRIVPAAGISRIKLKMGGWSDLDGGPADPPEGDVLAVCSIARPRAFAAGLRGLLPESDVCLASFADHHRFTRRDIAALSGRRAGRTVVCTLKDAPKLAAFPGLARHCVAVDLRVAGEPGGPLGRALAALAPS